MDISPEISTLHDVNRSLDSPNSFVQRRQLFARLLFPTAQNLIPRPPRCKVIRCSSCLIGSSLNFADENSQLYPLLLYLIHSQTLEHGSASRSSAQGALYDQQVALQYPLYG